MTGGSFPLPRSRPVLSPPPPPPPLPPCCLKTPCPTEKEAGLDQLHSANCNVNRTPPPPPPLPAGCEETGERDTVMSKLLGGFGRGGGGGVKGIPLIPRRGPGLCQVALLVRGCHTVACFTDAGKARKFTRQASLCGLLVRNKVPCSPCPNVAS